MKSFLLLILSLMAGCVASYEVKGCRGGWVEFVCGYNIKNTYRKIVVVNPNKTEIKITQVDVWKQEGNISLYHDTTKKKLRVAIKQLQSEDSGEYKCRFYQQENGGENGDNDEQEIEVEDDKDGCQAQFIQTAYRTAKTTITCNDQGNSQKKFFCKENNFTCEDILSTKSSPKSNGTFTLTGTKRGFNVSISNVSSHHAGVYWCGVKSNEGSYRAGLRKIQLEVKDITNFTRSRTIGQNFTYWCDYPKGTQTTKFICKGEDPSICEPLVNTMQPNKNTGRFSMKDDKEKRNITITVREVTTDDTGTYWCGAKSPDDKHSNPFFHRLSMTVVPPTASTPISTSPTSKYSTSSAVSTTTTTTASHETGAGDSRLTAVIAVVVCVALLALLLFLVLLYKRREHTKNTRNEEAQNNNEEAAYAEIQERPQLLGSGTALKTIYATANFPTNPSSASHEDPNTHTYSTVKDTSHQDPTYSTVNHPSGFSENPLYLTVNNPQHTEKS